MTERSRLDRRTFLARSAGGALGLLLARHVPLLAAPEEAPASACILVWLRGGPSQLETFDPKPGTRTGGPTRAIETAVRGLRFAEHLPELAERAKRLAVIRSLTSKEGDHTRAGYLLHTGFTPSTTARHPTLGSLISAELEKTLEVPSFVSLGTDLVGPGYRGVAHAPYVVGGRNALLDPQSDLGSKRLADRQRLLGSLEGPFARTAGLQPDASAPGGGAVSARAGAYARAARLLEGPLRGALDIEQEGGGTRESYGRGGTGTSLLTARRLVETGVRCVEVVVDGWDDHQEIFSRMPARCRELDRALAALIDDLQERERLERTLVVCMGEFGRTPDINQRNGRDHYPRAFSALLAGGGLPGGRVVGATTPDGREVAERPVSIPDLFATLAVKMGIDPKARRYAGERPITLVDGGKPLRELLPG